MSTRALTKSTGMMPAFFDDFFKPWNEWFDNGNLVRGTLTVPAVNVSEDEKQYRITVAAPGMEKKDFRINADRNMLTISAESEEKRETEEGRYSRQEYNYSSFPRNFTLPEDVNQDKIDARYQNGELQLTLPKKEDGKKAATAKQIAIQ